MVVIVYCDDDVDDEMNIFISYRKKVEKNKQIERRRRKTFQNI